MLLAAGPVADASVDGAAAAAQAPAQDEFVPIDELPPQEQLPAAPLLIAAYSVAWLAVAGYLFSIWRRLGRVEHELARSSAACSSAGRRPEAGSPWVT